jgi:hypothetical protein
MSGLGQMPGTRSQATARTTAADEARAGLNQARSTAVSALRNPRFGAMLDRIMDPRSSEMVAFMRSEGQSADNASATARYAENGE